MDTNFNKLCFFSKLKTRNCLDGADGTSRLWRDKLPLDLPYKLSSVF